VEATRRERGSSVSSNIEGMNGRKLATVWDAANKSVTTGESMNDGGITNKMAITQYLAPLCLLSGE
jgi:hypothetical protein